MGGLILAPENTKGNFKIRAGMRLQLRTGNGHTIVSPKMPSRPRTEICYVPENTEQDSKRYPTVPIS